MDNHELPSALFVSDEVVERAVELGDGKKHKLFFKAVSHVDFNRWVASLASSDEQIRDHAHSRLIAASLVNPDGTPALTVERADQLKPTVLRKLSDVIAEINDFAQMKGKG